MDTIQTDKSTPQDRSPKRHCMVVYAYYPLAETRVQRQAEALLAHGYEVDVICLRSAREPAYEVVRGVNVYRLPIARSIERLPNFGMRLILYLCFLILAAFKLIQLYRRKQYDVVQVHNLPDFLVFCALWPKLKGARVILDIHDVMPEFLAERAHRPLQSWPVKLTIWQEQMACRFADHVVTVTELWRQALIERGVPADKISVVMNLADSRLFHRGVQDQLVDRCNGQTFRLIYHGIQASRHGLDTLLRAVAQVSSQIPNLCLILHGRGEAQSHLISLVDELKLTQQVQFSTTYMPVTELAGFIASADIGVVPYQNDIFTGGILPTKLLECVALGLPVIAARTPAIEAYFDDTMLQFFEPGDVAELAASILKLYQDRSYRENLIRQSDRFNQRYNWLNQSADYVRLVDQLGC